MISAHGVEKIDESVLNGILKRTSNSQSYESFLDQGSKCGWCRQPIRLKGKVTSINTTTGELVAKYSTNTEPDGVLLKACGTRRVTRCPACATVYLGDARILVRSGLSGGKGLPETVAFHPMVFATLTAPSFGALHQALTNLSNSITCHPGPQKKRCEHGALLFCNMGHDIDDPIIGEPLCPHCYDYTRAILWNATCAKLWHRTTIAIKRELCRVLGISTRSLKDYVRVSFLKVAEYQKRGAIHLHAVIRIDSAEDGWTAPKVDIDTTLLVQVVRVAVTKASCSFPSPLTGFVRWGSQIEVRPIVCSGVESNTVRLSSRAVANYLAKYATKSVDSSGFLDRKITDLSELDSRGVKGHLRKLVETAWELGGRNDLELSRLRTWAHTLGFGGHWLTKSRNYSITFGSLRTDRQIWRVQQFSEIEDPSTDVYEVESSWKWVGIGWSNKGDAYMAKLKSEQHIIDRLLAREAKCIQLLESEVTASSIAVDKYDREG